MNLRTGPGGPGSFRPGATVACAYVEKELKGKSPKFLCRPDGKNKGAKDEMMVKFGRDNGEVYGEVLATRLLWALGFPADRMYPVTVICRNCPPDLVEGTPSGKGLRVEPAAIERKMSGTELKFEGKEGWSWDELDWASSEYGGAPRAQRDALKLLAVFLQHADNKREQQSTICRDARAPESLGSCHRPFLMISDLGLTFGRSNKLNTNDVGSVSLSHWQRTPVWKDQAGCTGNLSKSLTGTMADPVISEDGRRFLADLLVQLSDRQLRDLFTIARVTLRPRSPDDKDSSLGTIDEWVDTFREKRDEIVNRRCL